MVTRALDEPRDDGTIEHDVFVLKGEPPADGETAGNAAPMQLPTLGKAPNWRANRRRTARLPRPRTIQLGLMPL